LPRSRSKREAQQQPERVAIGGEDVVRIDLERSRLRLAAHRELFG